MFVNGVRAEGGQARGDEVARWRAEIALGSGAQEIAVDVRDASAARNASRVTIRVVVEDGDGPVPPTPPPAPTAPVVIVGGLTDPRAVVADETFVWWIDGAGRLGRSDLASSTTVVVTDALMQPAAMVRGDGGAVYVADGRGIWRVIAGEDGAPTGELRPVVRDEARITSLAVLGDFLVWADATRGEIRRTELAGGDVVVVVSGTPEPRSLRTSGGRLSWVELAGRGAIRSVTLDGVDPMLLAEGANTPALSVVEGQVVWGQVDEDGLAGRLKNLTSGVDDVRTLVDGLRRPLDVHHTGASIVWVETVADGVLWRAAADGTAAERLATGVNEPVACALQESGVLVVERAGGEPGAGRILRVGLDGSSAAGRRAR